MGNNDNLNFYTDFIRGYREPQYKALSCSIWPGMNWSQTGHWAVAEGQHQTQWGELRSNTAQGRPNQAWGTSWDQARTAACRGLVGPWLGPAAGSWGSAWLRPHCDRGWLPPGPELGSWACPGSIGQPRQTLVRVLEGDSSHCTHRSMSFPKGRFSDGLMVCKKLIRCYFFQIVIEHLKTFPGRKEPELPQTWDLLGSQGQHASENHFSGLYFLGYVFQLATALLAQLPQIGLFPSPLISIRLKP